MADKTTDTPLISVIVPIYNVEKFIRKCLDSLMNQTMKRIEVICIDDGSTDESSRIADEYCNENGLIRVIHHLDNRGLSADLNSSPNKKAPSQVKMLVIQNQASALCAILFKNKYNPDLFISPLQKNCEKHFSFSFDGTITGITPQGKYTVGLLNLNSYRLQRARRAHLKTALDYHDEELVRMYFLTPSESNGKMRQFPDIIEYFLCCGMLF